MVDGVSTQLRSKVRRVHRNEQALTLSPTDSPREETHQKISQLVIPLSKAPFYDPSPVKEGTNNMSSTNALLSNIIQTLCQQTQMIDDQNKYGDIQNTRRRSLAPRRVVCSRASQCRRRGKSPALKRSRSP